MLSLTGSSGHCWLNVLCKAIKQVIDPDGHDYDNTAVLQIFHDGEDWAREKKIDVPDVPIDHHAKAFFAARDAGREPAIPTFMRMYCAEVTGTLTVEGEKAKADAKAKTKADKKAEGQASKTASQSSFISPAIVSQSSPRDAFRMSRRGTVFA